MDQFKKYLRDHRSEMDVEVPPPAPVWSTKAGKQSMTSSITKWLVAASIVLVVSSIFYWMLNNADNNTTETRLVKNDGVLKGTNQDSLPDETGHIVHHPIDSGSRQQATEETRSRKMVVTKRSASTSKAKRQSHSSPLESLENNYAGIINYQLKRVERTPIYAESADYFHVFKKQWYDLEKDEEKIKADVQMLGINDIVVDQFIRLYQNKIELLKQLQSQIDKMNLKARNHPGFHDQAPTYLKM